MKKKVIIVICFLITIIVLFFASIIFFSREKDSTPTSITPTAIVARISNAPFIVTTPPVIPKPDIRSDAPALEWQQALEQYKGDEPDFYLMNFATYQGKTFNMSYQFKKTPTEHYAFTAKLVGPDTLQAKQDVISWIKSTGLTDAQISTLDIQYVE